MFICLFAAFLVESIENNTKTFILCFRIISFNFFSGLRCYFLLYTALLDENPTDITYKDHVKDHLNSMGLGENTKYHLERQTIMCSATIPQRYAFTLHFCFLRFTERKDLSLKPNFFKWVAVTVYDYYFFHPYLIPKFFYYYRQHFAASCFKNGWTATVPELINVSEDQLVPPQVMHMHIPCSAELRLPCLAAVLKSELSKSAMSSINAKKSGAEETDKGVETLEDNVHSEDDSGDRAVYTKQAIVFVDERQAHLMDTYAYSVIKTLKKLSTTASHNRNAPDPALLTSTESNQSTTSNTKPVNMRKAIEQQNRVGVLLESMSLEARARVLDDFRYVFCVSNTCGTLRFCTLFS